MLHNLYGQARQWTHIAGLLLIVVWLRVAGCTASGTWRAGAGMEFLSLWVVRTSMLRFAVFALSLGRSRRRCWGMGAYRRRRLWRGRALRPARSLLATLF